MRVVYRCSMKRVVQITSIMRVVYICSMMRVMQINSIMRVGLKID